jgi:hypothetical protein
MKDLLLLMSLLTICCFGCNSDQKETSEEETVEETPVEDTTIQIPAVEATFDSTQFVYEDGYLVLTWSTLADVDFEDRYSEELSSKVPFPIFSERLKSLGGKKVKIQGYVIPFEETGEDTYVILSAFPFSQCFFCGNAGPESVMDILPKDQSITKRLKMDQQTSFRGTFKLNDTDFYYLNYILEDAELVE